MGNAKSRPPTAPAPAPVAVVPVKPLPTVQARYIRINRSDAAINTGRHLNLTQIEVYDETNKKIIITVTPTVSPLYGELYGPQKLINGIKNKDNFSSTTDVPGAFIQLDLGVDKPVSRIVITNRIDCCSERIVGAAVQAINTSGTVLFTTTITKIQAVYDIPVAPAATGATNAPASAIPPPAAPVPPIVPPADLLTATSTGKPLTATPAHAMHVVSM